MTQPPNSDREKFWKDFDARVNEVFSDEKLMKLKAARSRQNSRYFRKSLVPRKPNV